MGDSIGVELKQANELKHVRAPKPAGDGWRTQTRKRAKPRKEWPEMRDGGAAWTSQDDSATSNLETKGKNVVAARAAHRVASAENESRFSPGLGAMPDTRKKKEGIRVIENIQLAPPHSQGAGATSSA